MDAPEETRDRARGRRKPAAKAADRDEGRNRKKSLCLSPEAWERLGVHAVKLRRSESAIVEELIRAHLRRFVVSDRGEPAASPEGPGRVLPMVEGVGPPVGGPAAEGPGQGRGARGRA